MTTTMADAENTDVPETIQEEASTEGTDQAQEAAQNDAATEEVAQEVQEASAAGDQPQQQEVEEGSGEAPTENTETPATPGAAESPGEAEQEAKKEEDSEQKEGEGGQEGKTAGEQAEQHHSTEGVREGPDDTASPTEQQLNTEEGTDKQDVEQQGLAEDAPTEQAAEGDGNTDAAPATEGDDTEAAKREGEEGQEAPAVEGETGETGDVTAEQGEEQQQEGEGQAEEAEVAQSPVPQADTFEQGSKPDSPMAVGEKLSREGSPIQQVLEPERTMSPPVPGSPGQVASLVGSDEEEEEEEEDYDEPQYDREALVERYHQALSERQQLQEQNYQLQHKLAEYFRRKKADDRQDMDKNVTDQEQRYLKYMANLDELRRQDAEERENFKQMIEEMKERCEDKQTKVHDEQAKFTEFKKEIALGSLNSRSGKPIPPRDVEQYFINESRKEEEVIKVRLENIKLKNKLKKKEAQLKSKEELAEGLHMIDFEQLKIENQTYNEKIEERNEELLKLRKKITSTVQVLTHLKEKLQFVTGENGQLKTTLQDVEEHAARKRDILSRTKQARDALRIDNQRLRQNCGLLGNESLLRDFEERKDESDDLRDKLDNLKTLHAELTLNLNGVRRKIQQAQVGRQ